MSRLDKLAENGNLELLAAYIKAERGCSDDEAWDNAYALCDKLDDMIREHNLPSTYAEIEYDDFNNPEAIDGARWDDKNFRHYMER